MANPLAGQELVAHVLVAAAGPHIEADYRHLVELWHRCADEFGIDQPLPPRPAVPPPDDPPQLDGIVAARSSRVGGLHQLVLRRVHDVFLLSLLCAPAAGAGFGWAALDAQWVSLLRPPTPGVLGTARILQARLADPAAALDVAVLGPTVATVSEWTGQWREGVERPEPPLGPFAVWEVLDSAARQVERDGRSDRRIVVVAPQANDSQLSAWTWSRGDDELTPFARYLMHAAMARYELRVWAATPGVSILRGETDRAITPLLRLAYAAAATNREPDLDELLAAATTLAGLQARELGLVDRATRLRDLRRTVTVAAANMTANAHGDHSDGLFADDKEMLAWFDQQLDHDLTYLEAAAERARSVSALGDQLVHRGATRRQERFNLGLTGVVGALLLVLAAIQSFGYSVPISDAVQPAVVALLGAFALLLSMVVLRVAAPRRRWPAAAVSLAAGLLGAATAWTIVAAATAAGSGTVAAWAGLGGIAGATAVTFLVRSQ